MLREREGGSIAYVREKESIAYGKRGREYSLCLREREGGSIAYV